MIRFFLTVVLFFFPLSCHAMIKTRVIVNPKSGVSGKQKIEQLLKQSLSKKEFDYELFYTKAAGHAIELSREAASQDYDLVVAVGGDGTVNEVGKGVIGSRTALGIIPSGSGNGLARHLGLPSDPKKAIEIIKKFQCRRVDTVQANNDYFLGVAGVGFDAHIAWKFAESKKRGFWSYAALVLQDYPNYQPKEFELEIDGKPVKTKALLLSFANSSQYGNDMKIAPHAKLDSGNLNVVILEKPPAYSLPRILMRMKKGTICRSSYYRSITCKSVKVKSKKVYSHIDGEPFFFEDEVLFKVLPDSLKIVVQ